jgi:hypothetical protein
VGVPVTQAETRRLIATFRHTAFRWEAQRDYLLGEEQADLQRFLDGQAVEPPDMDWYRPWLERMRHLCAEDKTISRVCVLDNPPTGYQQWRHWGSRWAVEAGEHIQWMSRSRSDALGLPRDHDWWLLDSQRLIVMRFTDTGAVAQRELITDPKTIESYLTWQHLAVCNAAEEMTAA